MGAPKKAKPVTKPQPTLRGYPAWVLLEWSSRKGPTVSELAADLLNRWIEENQEYLASRGLGEEDFNAFRRAASATVLSYGTKEEGEARRSK